MEAELGCKFLHRSAASTSLVWRCETGFSTGEGAQTLENLLQEGKRWYNSELRLQNAILRIECQTMLHRMVHSRDNDDTTDPNDREDRNKVWESFSSLPCSLKRGVSHCSDTWIAQLQRDIAGSKKSYMLSWIEQNIRPKRLSCDHHCKNAKNYKAEGESFYPVEWIVEDEYGRRAGYVRCGQQDWNDEQVRV